MEFLQELLFTVALSLLASFILAKLLSTASSCDVAEDKTVSAAKTVAFGHKRDKESVGLDFEREGSVRFVGEEEEFGVESVLICEDDEEVCRVVGIRGMGEKEGTVCVGGEEIAEKVFDKSPETAIFREIEIESAEESPERFKFRKMEKELVRDGASVAESEETEGKKGNESDGANNNVGVVDDEDEDGLFGDWEGIERTDLEKRFGAAVVFVGSKSNADRILVLGNDVRMELYGLHKIAIEGPCLESQPMALKVSARAKWNAWRRLTNMSREVAMEQYITLLSRSIPDWMGDNTSEVGTTEVCVEERDVWG